ncbi:MAG: hypothetical protein ACI4I8_01845 [Oscillospiraceae bacterium]
MTEEERKALFEQGKQQLIETLKRCKERTPEEQKKADEWLEKLEKRGFFKLAGCSMENEQDQNKDGQKKDW